MLVREAAPQQIERARVAVGDFLEEHRVHGRRLDVGHQGRGVGIAGPEVLGVDPQIAGGALGQEQGGDARQRDQADAGEARAPGPGPGRQETAEGDEPEDRPTKRQGVGGAVERAGETGEGEQACEDGDHENGASHRWISGDLGGP